jgi:hypothetical protein
MQATTNGAQMMFTVYCAAVIKQADIIDVGKGVALTLGQTVDATEVCPWNSTAY